MQRFFAFCGVMGSACKYQELDHENGYKDNLVPRISSSRSLQGTGRGETLVTRLCKGTFGAKLKHVKAWLETNLHKF